MVDEQRQQLSPESAPLLRNVLKGLRGQASALMACAAILYFCLAASRQITLPGLYYDELIQITPALDLIKGPLPSHQDVNWIPSSRVRVLGRDVYLMTMDYIGAVKQLAFAPVAAIWGTTPQSIRCFTIGVAALSLLATFAFAKVVLGPTAAGIAVVLLACDPSFIIYSRVDYGPTVFMMLAKSVALWQLAVWWKTDRTWALFFGFLALGIGTWDKANFVWIVAALTVAAGAIAPLGVWKRMTWRTTLVAVVAFVAGSWPLIWYNLNWPPPSLSALSLRDNPPGGALTQLWQRFTVLVELLDGTEVTRRFSWITTPRPWPILPILVGLTALLFTTKSLSPRRAMCRPAMFMLLCMLLIVAACAASRGAFSSHHVILAYPFPHLLAAAGVAWSVGRVWPRRVRLPVIVAATVLLGTIVASDIASVSTHWRVLARTGGLSYFSDAIYPLNDFLLQQADAPVIVLDWGILQNLVALSQGRLHCVSMWPFSPLSAYKEALARPRSRYVMHPPAVSLYPEVRQRFFEEAERQGLRPRLMKSFSSRLGEPMIDVYEIEAGTSTTAAIPTTLPVWTVPGGPSRRG